MASILYDTALMTQQVAAVPIVQTAALFAAHDENGNLMTLSIGNDSALWLCKQDGAGSKIMIDLREKLQLGSKKFMTFAASQNISDSTLFLVAAVSDPASSTPKTNGALVLKPFKPGDINFFDPNLNLSNLIIEGSWDTNKSISDVYIADNTNSAIYPDVVLTFAQLDRIESNTDLTRLVIPTTFDSWSLKPDVNLPEDGLQLRDLCVGNLPRLGAGFFSLYQIQDQVHMAFKQFGDFGRATIQTCSSDATKIAPFIDTSNPAGRYNGILITDQGLSFWNSKQLGTGDTKPTKLSDDPMFQGVRQLFVSQVQDQLTILVSNVAQAIGYVVTDTSELPSVVDVTLIAENGQGGDFSPWTHPQEQNLQLIVNANQGLTTLQQGAAQGHWSLSPISTPMLDSNIDVDCYTVHIEVLAPDKSSLTNQKVLLKCSDIVSVIINGQNFTVTPDGIQVVTDNAGVITMLYPSEDISSYVFTVELLDNEGLSASQAFVVDPSSKITDGMQNTTPDSLKQAPLQGSDQKLLDGVDISSQDLQQAADNLSQLSTAKQAIVTKMQQSKDPLATLRQHVAAREDDARRLYSESSNVTGKEGFSFHPWSHFHWLYNAEQKVESWGADAKATFFKIKFPGADEIRFLLKAPMDYVKAMAWVTKHILQADLKIIQWVGYLFDWKEIKATYSSIKSFLNSALQCARTRTPSPDHTGVFFDNVQNKMQSMMKATSSAAPSASQSWTFDKTLTDQDAAKSVGNQDNTKRTTSTSSPQNYSNYHFTHGGAATKSTIQDNSDQNPFLDLWNDVLKPAEATLVNTVKTVGHDIATLFFHQGNLSVAQALEKLGTDVVLGILQEVRTIVVGTMKFAAQIATNLVDYVLNASVQIPIFSALYKKFISPGNTLKIIDVLALLIAIPVTATMRDATKGKSGPADLTSLDFAAVLDGKITDPKTLDGINKFFSAVSIAATPLFGVLRVVTQLTTAPNGAGVVDAQSSADPLANARTSTQLDSGVGWNPFKDWKCVLGVMMKVFSIPIDPPGENYPENKTRWSIWVMSLSQTLISSALRYTSKADRGQGPDPSEVTTMLCVFKASLGITMFVDDCVVNNAYYKEDYPLKNWRYTTLNVFASVFGLVDCLASVLENIGVEDAAIVSYVSLALYIFATGEASYTKILDEGGFDYSWIIDFINVTA